MFIFSTKYKEQRVLQPNFLYGIAIFGLMGSFKGAAQKHQIMNYEQLLSSVFSCFHGLKNNLTQFIKVRYSQKNIDNIFIAK